MTQTHRLEPFVLEAHDLAGLEGAWPWMTIAVFPTVDDVETGRGRAASGFLYTIGADPTYDLWMPANSIEERGFDHTFAGSLLNGITHGVRNGVIIPGDTCLAEVGIPGPDYADNPDDRHDADAVFWVGQFELNSGRRQTFQSIAPRILPVLWSSPLGWRDEDGEDGG